MRSPILLLFAVAAFAGCASGSGAKSSSPHPDPNVITLEEIDKSTALTALEMVQSLRPRWLSKRGANSLRNDSPVVLYVNNSRVGNAERLREYAPRHLGEARYLDAMQATQRFGTGHRSGAIMIFFRQGHN